MDDVVMLKCYPLLLRSLFVLSVQAISPSAALGLPSATVTLNAQTLAPACSMGGQLGFQTQSPDLRIIGFPESEYQDYADPNLINPHAVEICGCLTVQEPSRHYHCTYTVVLHCV